MLQLQSFTFNPFQENTYLIVNEKNHCWVVDPGMYDTRETNYLFEHIRQHGLIPQAIINTHSHLDHIFGVQACKDAYGIPFLMHEKDMPVLQSAKGSAMLFGFEFGDVPKPDGYISEKETLKLGTDDVEIRLAPGHSPGSIVFYYAAGGWAVAGDVLFNGSIGRSDLPGGNFDTLIQSIKRELFTLPDETVIYSGHGPSTTILYEKQHNPFLQ